MHISEVKRMQEEKDYLMRHEGKHPANYNKADHERIEEMYHMKETAHEHVA